MPEAACALVMAAKVVERAVHHVSKHRADQRYQHHPHVVAVRMAFETGVRRDFTCVVAADSWQIAQQIEQRKSEKQYADQADPVCVPGGEECVERGGLIVGVRAVGEDDAGEQHLREHHDGHDEARHHQGGHQKRDQHHPVEHHVAQDGGGQGPGVRRHRPLFWRQIAVVVAQVLDRVDRRRCAGRDRFVSCGCRLRTLHTRFQPLDHRRETGFALRPCGEPATDVAAAGHGRKIVELVE